MESPTKTKPICLVFIALLLLSNPVLAFSEIEDGPSNIINILSGGSSNLLKSSESKMAIKYVAPASNSIDEVMLFPGCYFPEANQPIWNVQIQGDSAGNPDGITLGNGTLVNPQDEVWTSIDISPNPSLNKGETYWIVIEYLSGPVPTTTANWLGFYASIPLDTSEEIYLPYNYDQTNMYSNDNIAKTTVRYYDGSKWIADPNGRTIPTFAVQFEDGTYHGQAYRHNYVMIHGSNKVGQRFFNYNRSLLVTQLEMPWSVFHTSNSLILPNDDLYYYICEDNRFGTVIANGTFLSKDDVFISGNGNGVFDRKWYNLTFEEPVFFEKDKRYFMYFTSPNSNSTSYWGTDAGNAFITPTSSLYDSLGSTTYDGTKSFVIRTYTTWDRATADYGRDMSFKFSGYSLNTTESSPSTSGVDLSFTPSASNFEVTVGNSTNFEISSDQTFTSSTWYLNDAEVASGNTSYTHNWNTAGTYTVRFDGASSAGTFSRTWTVTVSDGGMDAPTSSSSTSLSFTPSAPTFESSVGDSTNFVVSSDQTFTSSTWYLNDAEVASGTTSYAQNWNTAGTHAVRFDGSASAGTISRTWTVTVSEPENTATSTVSIAPSSTVVAPGDSFTLDVYIDPGQPLSGSQFNLQYSSIVSASSVSDGGLFDLEGLSNTFNTGQIDNFDRIIRGIYSAIVGSGTISTAGTMATVDMVAGSTSGVVDFTLSNVVLSDASSNPAPYDVSYASVLVDTAPEFATIPSVRADETDSISFTVAATDAEGDALTYSATSLPGSATFDANTATFSWTPAEGDAGTYTASFAVTDGYLSDSVSATIIVEELNSMPVITLFEPAEGTVFEEGSTVDINVAGTDSDGQALSYIIKINGDTVSTSQSYSWTTDYSSAGTYAITAIVSDGIDDVSSTHTITITDLHPRWDVNEDSVVNVLDITLVGQNYGLTYTSEYPRWDVNQDGTVNIQDLSIVSGHFGETVL